MLGVGSVVGVSEGSEVGAGLVVSEGLGAGVSVAVGVRVSLGVGSVVGSEVGVSLGAGSGVVVSDGTGAGVVVGAGSGVGVVLEGSGVGVGLVRVASPSIPPRCSFTVVVEYATPLTVAVFDRDCPIGALWPVRYTTQPRTPSGVVKVIV